MFKDLIEGFVKDQIKNQISEKIGINLDDKEGAIHDVIGSLVGGMANNASKPEGAESLWKALDKDHDGSALEDIVGLVQGENKGDKIAGHIFGDKLGGIIKLIGGKNGLSSEQAMKLVTTIAPIVMAQLGKKKNTEGLGLDGLVSLLGGEKEAIAKDPAESPFTAFLDQDGDGDVDVMDLLKMAT